MWVYTVSGDPLATALQNPISSMWAWRLWWLVEISKSASGAHARPPMPPSGSGLFAPLLHCSDEDRHGKHKD